MSERQMREEIRQVRRYAARATERHQNRSTELAATVERLAAVTITSGQAPIPAMLLGATRQIVGTLVNPMPDATYSATATISSANAPNILGTVAVDGIRCPDRHDRHRPGAGHPGGQPRCDRHRSRRPAQLAGPAKIANRAS